ncbi:hypothetical protein DES46_102318 [Caldimonas thermodepolymerans]|nr:hypothetical protein DES46_102318 [Caldimonas thermodepolymerans]
MNFDLLETLLCAGSDETVAVMAAAAVDMEDLDA